LRAEGETKIKRSDAAIISYPAFYETLESLLER
jgi:5-enolpyruvylshikimate-3-phosphate synthase